MKQSFLRTDFLHLCKVMNDSRKWKHNEENNLILNILYFLFGFDLKNLKEIEMII